MRIFTVLKHTKMALLRNVIKKAEKLSGESVNIDEFNQHSVNYKGYKIQFYPNGKITETVEATNYYILKHGQKDELETDYFGGTFQDNIQQCFDFVDRMKASEKETGNEMTVYKAKDQSHNIWFIETNKELNPNHWEKSAKEKIVGEYLGSETYTVKQIEITEKKWGQL